MNAALYGLATGVATGVAMTRWGHAVEVGPDYAQPCGGAQVIRMLDGGVRAAGSDPRKDGCALAQ